MGRPVILGIVGDSAAGKTTIARGIAHVLGENRVTIICADDYHKFNRAERARRNITALHPASNYLDILQQHLMLLKDGKPILKPHYNHATGDFEPPSYVERKDFIIVEGLLGFHTRTMRDYYDVKLYLRPAENLRFHWKMKRDRRKPDASAEGIRRELAFNEADSQAFIRPQSRSANLVLCFSPVEGVADAADGPLNATLIIRPTLPLRPDLSSVIEEGGEDLKSFSLELDRDMKLPVDRLEISGHISDMHACSVKDRLWSLIPGEHQHLRGNETGDILGTLGTNVNAHSLALSLLLVSYHLLKAASGHEQ